MMRLMALSRKQIIGAVVGVLLTAGIVAAQPFPGLSHEACILLAVLAGAIAWWIAGVMPDYVVGFVMAVLFVVWAGVPTEVVFGAFSSSMWWLLVAAFCLAHGMRASGLLRRAALAVLRLFPRTFRAQAAGLMAAGLLVGPFVPSLSAKVAMLTPMALSISDEMGYERKQSQANGLFLATMTGVRTAAPAFLSASFLGYVVLGLLPDSVQQQFDMAHWLLAALPWLLITTSLTYLTLVLRYAPKGESSGLRKGKAGLSGVKATKDGGGSARGDAPEGVVQPACGLVTQSAAKSACSSATQGASLSLDEDLGPLSVGEKRVIGIMAVTAFMWFTESVHGIPAYAVTLLAVAAMVACGQFKREDIRSGVAWDVVLFVGLVLGLAPSFEYVGADLWVAQLCEPVLLLFAGNPYAIIVGISVVTVLLRFIIVSDTAFLNLFMAVAVPISATLGVSPWVVGFTVYVMVNPWFAEYQNPIYLAALGSVGNQMSEHGELAKYCAIYLAGCLVGLLASVPYWSWLGLV